MTAVSASRFQHERVWRIAAPMILSNISIPLLGLVDTAVMGHLDAPYYLGAVAVAALIFNYLYWGFGFLRMGTTGITAQAYGADDAAEMRATLARALIIAVVMSLLLWLFKGPIQRLAFYLIDASGAVEHHAAIYYDIRIWSAPAALMNYAFLGWFLGMQNARAPLAVLLVVNLSNAALDVYFVLVLDMQVAGIAWGSVAAEYLGLAVSLWLAARVLRGYGGTWRAAKILDAARLRALVAVNHNILIRTLCLIFAFSFFTAQSAEFGDVVLAANAVLMNFQTFMAYGLDGFAHAAEALTGRAIGARDRRAFHNAVNTAALWSVAVAGLFVIAYLGFGRQIIFALTDLEQVRDTALEYLPWVVIAPVVSVWSYLLDGVFIGATRSVEMRNTMLTATFVFFLPAWYLLQPAGVHGLWLAFVVFMAARGLTMGWTYRRLDASGRLIPDQRN